MRLPEQRLSAVSQHELYDRLPMYGSAEVLDREVRGQALSHDGDCGSGGVCKTSEDATAEQGRCFKSCTSSSQCGGEICTSEGLCGAAECTSDSQCGGGICRSGKCRNTGPCLTEANSSSSGECAFPDDPDEFCPDEQWFSLVLVPDTQAYAREDKKAATFDWQTERPKANKDLRIGERHEGIKFVLHEGDIVYGGS